MIVEIYLNNYLFLIGFMTESDDIRQVTWIILNAVKELEVGVDKLALFLKGSKSKLVVPIESKQLFGGLMWHEIITIKGFIKQLLEMEFIRRRTLHYGYYPFQVLELTDAGKKVLHEKIRISLQIIREEKPAKVGDSEKITLELFNNGKNAEEISKGSGLAVSTIYTHFYRLIVNGYLSSHDVY